MAHTGFCLGEYEEQTCADCPTLTECLELRDREQKEQNDDQTD